LKKHPNKRKDGGVLSSCPPWQGVILLFGFLFVLPCHAQNAGFSDSQGKAAFVYNFVKFVDWPPQTFTNETSPYVIGILGDKGFGDDLEQIVTNEVINGRKLVLEKFRSTRQVDDCQVLFIDPSEKHHFKQILAELRGKSILTISQEPYFIADGGMINFVMMPDKTMRFQINNPAAMAVGLEINSDLLALALPSH
jgi:hypothetical protein